MGFDESLDHYVESVMPRYADELMTLVRVPSISAGTFPVPQAPPELEVYRERRAHLLSMARTMGDVLNSYGFFEFDAVINDTHNPLIIASMVDGPTLPWVTIYNHMDVQPAAEPEWTTDPFKPVLQDGKIIGRGTTDDKGPALGIIHAINFLRKNGYALPNIQIIYETEEEIGSPNFGRVLEDLIHTGKVHKPDSILISDTVFQGDNPTISYKMRGMLRLHMFLQTATKEVHSGTTGGVSRNAFGILMRAALSCKDEEGRILISGFYDNVPDLSQKEWKELGRAAERFDLERFKRDTGVEETTTSDAYTALRRLWHDATFELHGAEGIQYKPSEIKSVVPGKVTVKASIRLIPGQDPEDILKKVQAYVIRTHPNIKVTGNGQPASIIDTNNSYAKKAEEACLYGFESNPVYVGCGATIGSVPQFQRIYPGVPMILISQSLLSDGYHAPNECFSLDQAAKGIKVMAKYLHEIAKLRA